MTDVWLKCSACRKDIGFQTVHWVCSVSTCNRSRTRLVFCSVPCWDSHVATLRHREAWAVEARSPTRAQWQTEQAAAPADPPAPRPSSPPVVRAPGSSPSAVVRPAAPSSPSAAPSSPSAAPGSPSAAPSSPSAAPSSPSAAPDDVRRRIVSVAPSSPEPAGPELSDTFERDILVVVSKMKKYIRDRSGMNCSDAVAEGLSDHLRLLCDQCIRTASADGRKTVLERDVPKAR